MGKFFKISELSQQSGVHLESIRYYEKQGLLDPVQRQDNGYRLFEYKHLEQLHFIKACRAIGFDLEECKQLLQLQKQPHSQCHLADELAQQRLQQIDQQIKQLQYIKALLLPLVNCQANDVAHCQIIQGMKHLQD